MTTFALALSSLTAQSEAPQRFDTLWDMFVRGGPVMIPLVLCSIIALAWILERAIRLRSRALGNRALSEHLVASARDLGPARALEIARADGTALARIYQPVFERWSEPESTLEKVVEDTGSREIRGLMSSLRPLTVIAVIAPLLGLFGTVIGIIIAFRDIAQSDAMGKPEALATGIAQALITTASGLAIAIPTQAAYYWFRTKVDHFWRLVEETGERVFAVHAGRTPPAPRVTSAPAAPVAPIVPAPAQEPTAPVSVAAQGTP
jgi:biopolymer transport protein ExbB